MFSRWENKDQSENCISSLDETQTDNVAAKDLQFLPAQLAKYLLHMPSICLTDIAE